VGTDRWRSYAELAEGADRIAAGLSALGVAKGDPVALLSGNRPEAVEVLFACARLGAIAVPLNWNLRGEFLRYQLADCRARILVADAPGAAMSAGLLAGLPVVTLVLLDGEDADASHEIATVTYRELRTAVPLGGEAGVRMDDLLGIIYTSGTTGMPKGCMLSHGYYVASGWGVRDAGWLLPGDRMFTSFPHFHTSFQLNALMATLVNDASLVLEPEFHASTHMRRAQEERATMLWGLGTMASAILTQPAQPGDFIETLRLSAWAPLPPDRQRDFQKRFGGVVNCEAYGQTEAVPITITQWDRPSQRPFVIGPPSPLYEVRIVDQHDEPVPPGQIGEIVVRPKIPFAMFSGYWHQPEATAAALRNLWHHTGDLASAGQDGRLIYHDRAKDAIRRRGENVSCYELELVVGQHPKVARAAACAVPSPLGEDDIKMSLVLHDGTRTDAVELFEFFRGALPYYAVPRYVEVRAELPLTATGRVRKDVLREEGLRDGLWDFEALGLTIARGDRRGPGGR
jgi:carnitine-CoA ligase